MLKEKKVRFSKETINFGNFCGEILETILQLNTGEFDTQNIEEYLVTYPNLSVDDAEILESVFDLKNQSERNLYNIIRYYSDISVAINRISGEWLRGLAKGCLRYDKYLKGIKGKQNIDFKNGIVGKGHPDFMANNIFYKVITSKPAIDDDKERARMFYRLVFHDFMLNLDSIKEYRVYDLNRDAEYRLRKEDIDEDTLRHIRALSKVYESRFSYKPRLMEKITKEKFVETPGTDITYSYLCPCGTGAIRLNALYENKDVDGQPNRIIAKCDCRRCNKYIVNVSRGIENFYLVSENDELGL